MFDADGEADEVVGDAEFFADFGRDGDVGHEGGVLDEGFHAAEGFGEGEEMDFLEEFTGFRFAAFYKYGQHPTAPGNVPRKLHLFLSQVVLGMGGEAGVDDAVDFRVGFEP